MPIILTTKNSLPLSVKNYINKNNIDKSYIIGGKGIISDSIKQSLKNSTRISGSDRYSTNIAILKEFKYETPESLCIATSNDYPDALTGSVLASKTNSPIILLGKSVNDCTKTYVTNALKSVKNIKIFGGEGVVSTNSLKEAKGEITTSKNNTSKISASTKPLDINHVNKDTAYFKEHGDVIASIDCDHIEVGDSIKLKTSIQK